MAINLKSEADKAGKHPSRRFGQRERKMLESVAAQIPFTVVKVATANHAGSVNATITDSAILATDTVMVQLKTSTNDASVVKCAAATGSAVIKFNADPGASVISYIVVRALA